MKARLPVGLRTLTRPPASLPCSSLEDLTSNVTRDNVFKPVRSANCACGVDTVCFFGFQARTSGFTDCQLKFVLSAFPAASFDSNPHKGVVDSPSIVGRPKALVLLSGATF